MLARLGRPVDTNFGEVSRSLDNEVIGREGRMVDPLLCSVNKAILEKQ